MHKLSFYEPNIILGLCKVKVDLKAVNTASSGSSYIYIYIANMFVKEYLAIKLKHIERLDWLAECAFFYWIH